MHVYLLGIGFEYSTADSCLYNLDKGGVLLLIYVDDIVLLGEDDE